MDQKQTEKNQMVYTYPDMPKAKNVTLGEMTFVIQKMPVARTMSLASLVLSKAEPMLGMFKANEEGKVKISAAGITKGIISLFKGMDEKTLDYIINTCFTAVLVLFDTGTRPLLESSGTYSLPGMVYDVGATLELCAEVIKYNLEPFFQQGGAVLAKLLGTIAAPTNGQGTLDAAN